LNDSEVWKDIKGFEGLYQVSNMGRMKILAHNNKRGYKRKGKIMKLSLNAYGYKQVGISKNDKHYTRRVHRLVAQAFIPNPNNYPIINHKDEVKTNNKVSNLEWCTVEYNNNYGTRNARGSITKTNGLRCKKVAQLDKKGNLIKVWISSADAGRHGYNQSDVSACCYGLKEQHKGYFWIYYSEYIKMDSKDIQNYIFHKKDNKKIVQLTKNNELIKIWRSENELIDNGFDGSCVSNCCYKKQKTHKKYKWMFYNDYIELNGSTPCALD